MIFTANTCDIIKVLSLFCRFVDAIETVDDLINSGMRWGAPDEAWTYSMLNDETVSDNTPNST